MFVILSIALMTGILFALNHKVMASSLEKVQLGEETIQIRKLGGNPVIDIQLVENTDQCLVDCYAILKIFFLHPLELNKLDLIKKFPRLLK